MARRVYFDVTVRLVIDIEEGVSTEDVIQELEYEFSSAHSLAEVRDTEILDYNVVDSK